MKDVKVQEEALLSEGQAMEYEYPNEYEYSMRQAGHGERTAATCPEGEFMKTRYTLMLSFFLFQTLSIFVVKLF